MRYILIVFNENDEMDIYRFKNKEARDHQAETIKKNHPNIKIMYGVDRGEPEED